MQDEVVDPSQPLDVQEPAKGLKELPTPLTRLAAWLERRFGLAGKLSVLRRPRAGAALPARRRPRESVLDRVREMLPQNPRVLVGHSLGSIVAYEALCRIPDHGITTLITLGSPLGLRSIREGMSQKARDRMPNLPPGVLRWVNIYDPQRRRRPRRRAGRVLVRGRGQDRRQRTRTARDHPLPRQKGDRPDRCGGADVIGDDQILRRHFIAIATRTYEASGTFAAARVEKEVAVMRGWLADEALGERRFDDQEYAALAHDPAAAR